MRILVAVGLVGAALLIVITVRPAGRPARARLPRIAGTAPRTHGPDRPAGPGPHRSARPATHRSLGPAAHRSVGTEPNGSAGTRPHRSAGTTPRRPAGSAVATADGDTPRPRRNRLPRWADPVRLGAACTGLATALVVGGWLGVVLGVLVAVGLDRALRRLEPAEARRRRLREAADLPLAADLLAAALRAGAPVDRAVAAVAEVLASPLGDRLDRVARTLRLGGDPREAWAYLAPVPGGDRLVAAAVRSSASGSALAGTLNRLADDLRADRATQAEAAARRAGVLIVLPLGLCFLPAFILAGLVPVVVAVLGDVW